MAPSAQCLTRLTSTPRQAINSQLADVADPQHNPTMGSVMNALSAILHKQCAADPHGLRDTARFLTVSAVLMIVIIEKSD